MKSPFKFLDAYTLEDKEVFFGRREEVLKLFGELKKNRLVLVYGQSGTGKTSLVQCGLASQYELTDWLPISIRRGENINASFSAALEENLGSPMLKDYPSTIQRIFALYLRPIYLIFDQFEELFILGSPEERKQFIDNIETILSARIACRILFVLREEYLPYLYEFELTIPFLMDSRLRVEPMNNVRVKEVMQSSFSKFNIQVQGDSEQQMQIMIDNISGEKTGIQLPYLQVYLDMLYRKSFSNAFNGDGNVDNLPSITFSETDISELGKMENVLEQFLIEQESEIQKEIQHLEHTISDQAVSFILDGFVTDEGTKRPIHYHLEDQNIQIDGRFKTFFPNLPEEILSLSLKELEQRRIIRLSDTTIELAHDSLAALIYNKRTDEQKRLNEISSRISAAYREYRASDLFLTKKQLNTIDPYLDQINLPDHLNQFVDNSRKAIKELEEEELLRQKEELEKEKQLRNQAEVAQAEAQTNEKKARQQRNIARIISVITLLAMSIAFIQFQIANQAKERAEEEERKANVALNDLKISQARTQQLNYERYLESGKLRMQAGNYRGAITLFQVALTYDSTQTEPADSIKVAEQKFGITYRFQEFMDLGDIAFEKDNLIAAIRNYIQANKLNVNQARKFDSQNKIDQCQNGMVPKYDNHIEAAVAFKNARNCSLARQSLNSAKSYHPYLKSRDINRQKSIIEEIEAACKN